MPKTILAIDDEEEFLEEIKFWLGENGYDVVTAKNGEEGLEKASRTLPHLILLDIAMPTSDGFEVLSGLRNNRQTSSIPVIMLTAREDSGAILRSQHLKAQDYVTKPFHELELLNLIRRHEM